MKNLQPMRHGPQTKTTRHYLIGLLGLASLLVASPALAGPLHDAESRGDLDEVKRLIAEGADVNAKAKNGQTPRSLAIEYGNKYGNKELADLFK